MEKINLEKLISHTFTLDEWERTFKIFKKKEGIKVIIKPWSFLLVVYE